MDEMEAGLVVTWLDEPELLQDYPGQPCPFPITPAIEAEARGVCAMVERDMLQLHPLLTGGLYTGTIN